MALLVGTRESDPPPLTVIAFVGLLTLWMVADVAVAALWILPVFYFLWRGAGIAWLILVVLFGSNLVYLAAHGKPWWWLAINVGFLALLLVRPTRNHVAGSRAAGPAPRP